MTQAQAPEQQAGEEPRQGAQDRSRKILGAVCVTARFYVLAGISGQITRITAAVRRMSI